MEPKCHRRAKGGFTLLELLVAMAIVIVLAGISFQVYTNMVQGANLTRA
ncbi:MAG TPA: type IV pilin protein, partial [Verrucomicrobiales bacterium]|nr:type IV pilin protein [Verrucomicrobiales bacterium]